MSAICYPAEQGGASKTRRNHGDIVQVSAAGKGIVHHELISRLARISKSFNHRQH